MITIKVKVRGVHEFDEFFGGMALEHIADGGKVFNEKHILETISDSLGGAFDIVDFREEILEFPNKVVGVIKFSLLEYEQDNVGEAIDECLEAGETAINHALVIEDVTAGLDGMFDIEVISETIRRD